MALFEDVLHECNITFPHNQLVLKMREEISVQSQKAIVIGKIGGFRQACIEYNSSSSLAALNNISCLVDDVIAENVVFDHKDIPIFVSTIGALRERLCTVFAEFEKNCPDHMIEVTSSLDAHRKLSSIIEKAALPDVSIKDEISYERLTTQCYALRSHFQTKVKLLFDTEKKAYNQELLDKHKDDISQLRRLTSRFKTAREEAQLILSKADLSTIMEATLTKLEQEVTQFDIELGKAHASCRESKHKEFLDALTECAKGGEHGYEWTNGMAAPKGKDKVRTWKQYMDHAQVTILQNEKVATLDESIECLEKAHRVTFIFIQLYDFTHMKSMGTKI